MEREETEAQDRQPRSYVVKHRKKPQVVASTFLWSASGAGARSFVCCLAAATSGGAGVGAGDRRR